jgi:hypothetical protein
MITRQAILFFGLAAGLFAGEQPIAWRLALEVGSQGHVGPSTQAYSRGRAALLEKTSSLGSVTPERVDPRPVEPGAPREVTIYTETEALL